MHGAQCELGSHFRVAYISKNIPIVHTIYSINLLINRPSNTVSKPQESYKQVLDKQFLSFLIALPTFGLRLLVVLPRSNVMESFYLKNTPRYHQLLNLLDTKPKPRRPKSEPNSTIRVSARIRPLSQEEGFPSAIFPQVHRNGVVDVHDLYNHPRGKPILKV